jgi:hypothetical protein
MEPEAGSRKRGAFNAAGPVHEDAGDDRRVGDDGHDAHRRGTPWAREGIDLVDAPEQLRAAVAARRDQFTGSAIATGPSTERPSAVGPTCRQPSAVSRQRPDAPGSPWSGWRTSRSSASSPDRDEKPELVQGRGAGRGPVEREGVAGAVAGEAERERTVSRAHPDAGMNVEARVGPLDPRRPPKIPHLWPPQTPPPECDRLSA